MNILIQLKNFTFKITTLKFTLLKFEVYSNNFHNYKKLRNLAHES